MNYEEDTTSAVRKNHVFDTNALDKYLASRLPGYVSPLTVKQFTVCV